MSRCEAAGSAYTLHHGIIHEENQEIQRNAAIAIDAFDSMTQI